jgi:peptide/nickel transport system permease protein
VSETETAPATHPSEEHHSLWYLAWRRLRRSWSAIIGLLLVFVMVGMAVIGPWVAPKAYDAQDNSKEAYQSTPSAEAWFGRDDLGRDIFSRILHGAHLTLGVGFATVSLGLVFGVPLGLISGYYRGGVDMLIMRLTDILLAFPDILLALAVMAVLGPSLKNAMIAVGILFVPKFIRVVRASALLEGGREYILAAQALGASDRSILFRHMLPNCLPPLIVISTLSLGTAILYTSALSFLGLGAQPPLPEWGAMLAQGKDGFMYAPHLVLFPGVAIALSVLGINLLGDGMRDALDVRLN